MSVRTKSYSYPQLHPIFEMYLPEGYLLSIIKKLFSKLTETDDFGLLRLLAPCTRGRDHYQDASEKIMPTLSLDDLVDFIALCADREKSPKAANQVFMISDNEDVSTTQLLRKVAKAQNKQAWLIPVPVWLMKLAAVDW